MQSPSDPKSQQKSKPPIPETVGATSAPIKIGKSATTTPLEVHAPTGPALLRKDGSPKRVLLRVENVTSRMPAPSIDVYVNLPPGEEPEKYPGQYALTISTFGMVEASKTGGGHPGNGLSFVRDITDLYLRLTARQDWDGKTLQLSFIPEPSGNYPVQVTVGRVSLLIE
jgi:hypothetical protein